MKLTVDQLKAMSPRMAKNPKTCAALFPFLVAALEEAAINTELRIAAFLAQVFHESGEFKYWQELWGPTEAQKRYEPPSPLATRLGNTEPGDGHRFMGRGPIQLTGRANYRAAGKALGLDLETTPEKVAETSVGFRTTAWFWKSRGLNELADVRDFDAITKRINGGTNGSEQRWQYYRKNLSVLIPFNGQT